MGDLGNFVPYANFLPSNDPFTVKCKFNTSKADKSLSIMKYGMHELYVGVPVTCVANYQTKDILAVDMSVNMNVRVVI